MAAFYFHKEMQPDWTKRAVELIAKAITEFGVEHVDAVAFTGISGALAGPIIAYLLNKPVIVVRQHPNDHGGCKVESALALVTSGGWDKDTPISPAPAVNYIIVDDFIDSGNTVKRIVAEIERFHPGSIPQGVYCYGSPPGMQDQQSYVRTDKWQIPCYYLNSLDQRRLTVPAPEVVKIRKELYSAESVQQTEESVAGGVNQRRRARRANAERVQREAMASSSPVPLNVAISVFNALAVSGSSKASMNPQPDQKPPSQPPTLPDTQGWIDVPF